MFPRPVAILSAAALLGPWAAAQSFDILLNGDFEARRNDWTVTSGNWSVNNGTFDPDGPTAPQPPIAGGLDLVSHQTAPGINAIHQLVNVPPTVNSATLSWSDRIFNHAFQFVDPSQEFRVVLRDAQGSLLHEVFSTNPSDVLIQPGPNARSFDITTVLQGLAGQTCFLAFEEEDSLFHFNVAIDEVRLVVSGPNRRADFRTFGTGCFALTLDSVGGSRPLIGSNFSLDLQGISSTRPTLAFLLMGFTRTQVSLASFAMPGCSRYTSTEISSTFLPSNAPQALTFAIPNDPMLIGVDAHVQVGTFSPSFQFLPYLSGFAMSNGCTLSLGDY